MIDTIDQIQELAEQGFLCELVTDGWANWKFSKETGLPIYNTAKPGLGVTKAVGWRPLYWYFDKEGKLHHDDLGMYESPKKAYDALSFYFQSIIHIIDANGFK